MSHTSSKLMNLDKDWTQEGSAEDPFLNLTVYIGEVAFFPSVSLNSPYTWRVQREDEEVEAQGEASSIKDSQDAVLSYLSTLDAESILDCTPEPKVVDLIGSVAEIEYGEYIPKGLYLASYGDPFILLRPVEDLAYSYQIRTQRFTSLSFKMLTSPSDIMKFKTAKLKELELKKIALNELTDSLIASFQMVSDILSSEEY